MNFKCGKNDRDKRDTPIGVCPVVPRDTKYFCPALSRFVPHTTIASIHAALRLFRIFVPLCVPGSNVDNSFSNVDIEFLSRFTKMGKMPESLMHQGISAFQKEKRHACRERGETKKRDSETKNPFLPLQTVFYAGAAS